MFFCSIEPRSKTGDRENSLLNIDSAVLQDSQQTEGLSNRFPHLTSRPKTLSVGSSLAGYVRCDVVFTCMSGVLGTWLIKVKGT